MSLHGPLATPSVEIVTAGAWSTRRGQHAAPHRHGAWKITYYRTGRITSIVDGTSYEVTPGTVLVLRPDQAHEEIARTAYSNYYTLVDAPVGHPWPKRCDGEAAHDAGRICGALLREFTAPDARTALMTQALAAELDVTLRRYDPALAFGAPQRTVQAAERLIEEAYASPLTVATLAAAIGISASTLRAHFATAAGIGPLAFLRDIRLQHALDLLHTSDLPLTAVAARCGFDSASHLSRHVKAAAGESPGRLRRRAQPAQR